MEELTYEPTEELMKKPAKKPTKKPTKEATLLARPQDTQASTKRTPTTSTAPDKPAMRNEGQEGLEGLAVEATKDTYALGNTKDAYVAEQWGSVKWGMDTETVVPTGKENAMVGRATGIPKRGATTIQAFPEFRQIRAGAAGTPFLLAEEAQAQSRAQARSTQQAAKKTTTSHPQAPKRSIDAFHHPEEEARPLSKQGRTREATASTNRQPKAPRRFVKEAVEETVEDGVEETVKEAVEEAVKEKLSKKARTRGKHAKQPSEDSADEFLAPEGTPSVHDAFESDDNAFRIPSTPAPVKKKTATRAKRVLQRRTIDQAMKMLFVKGKDGESVGDAVGHGHEEGLNLRACHRCEGSLWPNGCDGKTPCGNCKQKKIECVLYPYDRRLMYPSASPSPEPPSRPSYLRQT